MPKCKGCGNRFSVLQLTNGACDQCIDEKTPRCLGCNNTFALHELKEGYCQACYGVLQFDKKHKLAEKEQQEQIQAVVLTTESSPNFEIKSRIDIISAECVSGANLIQGLCSPSHNVSGEGRNTAKCMFKDIRKTVLNDLRKEANALGANAVVGVSLNYNEITDPGNSNRLLIVVATGTAVIANVM